MTDTKDQANELYKLFDDGQRIAAISRLRKLTDCGLKEALHVFNSRQVELFLIEMEKHDIRCKVEAAAPALLAACKNSLHAMEYALAVMPKDDPLRPKIELNCNSSRAAIAQAEGRGE